jgi:uncharacterized membrane protein YfcA
MIFHVFIFATAVLAAAIAAVAGFGIGSLLTPAFGLVVDTRLAVAAVSVPHLTGTGVRFWALRRHVEGSVLWRFGIASAIGGLAGALLHNLARVPWLTAIFGALLLFVAASELSGLSRRMRFHGTAAWVAGVASGLFGGLVGNQGGIRSAALLGFDLDKRAFVATATAIGLIVDAARMPVYVAGQSHDLARLWVGIAVATVGVILGTLFGGRVLARWPDRLFRPAIAVLLGLLGGAELLHGLGFWRA